MNTFNNTSTIVPPAPPTAVPVPTIAIWQPDVGDEWRTFIHRTSGPKELGSEGEADLLSNCASILGKCVPPTTEHGSRTGLVLGCIQSGKTVSFTGVTCLARDNGFRIVIVISGTAIGLLEQTRARLGCDLGFTQGGAMGWMHIQIDAGTSNDQTDEVVKRLQSWRQPSVPTHLRRTVIVTVLKHAAGLRKTAEMLRSVALKLPGGMVGVPALIVDDECDQASLNTRARAGTGESVTYAAIRELRAELPNHTYLQYTATAQAPLLLSIADTLSPDFCHVLDPGAGYTGAALFLTGAKPLNRVIPAAEVAMANGQVPFTPPPSLLHAMACYVLGLAQEIGTPGTLRTMVIHNAREVAAHGTIEVSVREVLRMWRQLLDAPNDDRDRQDFEDQLRDAWNELRVTAADLKPLAELIQNLPNALHNTTVKVLNSKAGTFAGDFPWSNASGWILIGGQALDRGFTVKGLTITYMARDLPATGQGNADTLQQRARFFGYRDAYLPYCRVWMTGAVNDAMLAYFEHEQALRDSLRPYSVQGRQMRLWRREFLLDASLAPTRRNVLRIPYQQLATVTAPTRLEEPRIDGVELDANREILHRLLQKPGWTEWFDGDGQTESQRHRKLVVPLRSLIDEVLEPWHSGSPSDSSELNMRIVQAGVLLARNPDAMATLVQMSPRTGPREREVSLEDVIDNLMQGSNPGKDGKAAYAGDAKIHAPTGITVQLHVVDLHHTDPDTRVKRAVATNIPTLVIVCPDRVPMVVQQQ